MFVEYSGLLLFWLRVYKGLFTIWSSVFYLQLESFYDYIAFRTRWNMPGNTSGGNGNMWSLALHSLIKHLLLLIKLSHSLSLKHLHSHLYCHNAVIILHACPHSQSYSNHSLTILAASPAPGPSLPLVISSSSSSSSLYQQNKPRTVTAHSLCRFSYDYGSLHVTSMYKS
jgi:hypothetical protein